MLYCLHPWLSGSVFAQVTPKIVNICEYINNISLENNSSHLNKYSCKEVKRIDDELKKINHEIKDNDEINE